MVAIQEIRAADQSLLPQFVEIVNSTGRRYEYALGPRLGRTSSKEQYAFLFDSDRIEIDRTAVYTVDDPDDLLHREPLVAPFRVRGPPAADAFTFTLIDIHTDPDEVRSELDALDDVIQAVRNDGRGEDDVILLGDLNTDDEHLGRIRPALQPDLCDRASADQHPRQSDVRQHHLRSPGRPPSSTAGRACWICRPNSI